MNDMIRFSGVTLNAPDALALARFYAEITGGIARGSSGCAVTEGPYGYADLAGHPFCLSMWDTPELTDEGAPANEERGL